MRGVVFTFDDDVSSHYDVVAPTFEKYGLTATFFINGSQLNMWKRVVDDNKVCYGLSDMSDDDIVELHHRGFEIGNHSYDHVALPKRDGVVITSFEKTATKLEGLGIPRPTTACYPGYYIPNDRQVSYFKKAGFHLGRVGYSPVDRLGDWLANNPHKWERGLDSYYVPGESHPLRVPCCGCFCDHFTFELFKEAIDKCPDEAYCVFSGHVFSLPHQTQKLDRVCGFCRENNLNVIQFKDLPV